MNTNSIIKSLNLTDGEVLTLEKLADRMEFEAFSGVAGMLKEGDINICLPAINCGNCLDCPDLCHSFDLTPCDCDGPVGYINCHPYRG
jgi:hypothetical protein